MTYKQKDARIKRGKLDGVNTHTLDKTEYAQRLMDKLANGDKMKPEGKQTKPSSRKPGIPPDPYRNYEKGVCSGCHMELVKAPDGRVFHRMGVSSDCSYGVPDYTYTRDLWNHSIHVTVGGVTRTYSMFDVPPIIDRDKIEMNVPEWCFFDMEFV